MTEKQLAQLDRFVRKLALRWKKPLKIILTGAWAVAVWGHVRATQDVDFLVDSDDAEFVHTALTGLDYQCVHRSEDAANYVRGDQGLDLLFARRPAARRLLAGAGDRATTMGRIHVVSAEGLIGFKLQALTNDPSRRRDLEDIRALLHAQRGHLNMQELREFFALFDRMDLLDELLAELPGSPT